LLWVYASGPADDVGAAMTVREARGPTSGPAMGAATSCAPAAMRMRPRSGWTRLLKYRIFQNPEWT